MLQKLLLLFYVAHLPTPSQSLKPSIMMDGSSNTQLYFPNSVPHSMGDVSFHLAHCIGSKAVHLNSLVYIIGGYCNGVVSPLVTVFNPATNSTSNGPPLSIPRAYHTAAAVLNGIIVCGGECLLIDVYYQNR
jgi:hypothetical protein